MTSSLISYARRDIHEHIPGMQVSDYVLEKCEEDVPTILHVNDSYYFKTDVDGNQDRVFVPSEQIVKSLVHMHLTSQLAFKPDPLQGPALFCVPNRAINKSDFGDPEVKKEALAAKIAQKRWFVALVKIADDDWQQYKAHRMVSDIQRVAAKELGLKRDWLMVVDNESPTEECPFCASKLLNPNAPICPNCGKVHNPAKLAELEARLSKSGITAAKVQ